MKNEKQIKCEIYSRVVGYFRPISQWNKGKQTEYRDRHHYHLNEPGQVETDAGDMKE